MAESPENNLVQIEKKWREFWEKEKIFKFNPKSKKKIYAIDTPPPTVSGEMHIGHACSYSQQDFIARYKRMRGFEVFYPFGTDDNGLPTERLVEKTRNIKAKEMPRDEFVKLCLEFLKKELPKFIQDWKNIGMSCDFDLYYSTINDHSRRVAQWSFLDLYKKKRLDRKDAPSMWCPECKTGVAQVEVQDKEIATTFNDIVFKIGKEDLVVATTRPELLPACVSLFYHPSDERYKKFKGKKAKVPLFDFEVIVQEDERADPEKGTGLVMCCTFGDQTDMEWQKAHNLPIKMAITPEGKMSSIAGKYAGFPIKGARKQILVDLKEAGLLLNQKPLNHFVNVHERCGTEIEFIKSKQWFVRYLDLKEDMLKWGAELNWYPEHMKHRYDNWVKGLQWDWLISNQRHFGVAFPVWYCAKCGETIVAEEKQLPVDPIKDKPTKACPKCKSKEFIAETDVLNTWFTSSMTPQIAIQLADKETQKKLFPMDLRPQAHDIITFWLFNTVVKSHLHFGKKPWKDVILSGYVTKEGEKMSKSKGNIIRPQEVMDKFGSDAIRYWAASSKLGEDFDYQEKDVMMGKKFVTKIINATKFVFMNLEGYDGKKPVLGTRMETIDLIFLDKLNKLIKSATENFDKYEYSRAKSDVELFFWSDFCDNYLEIVKKRIYSENNDELDEGKISAQYTLYHALLTLVKLFAPFTPFITEEIYQEYFRKNEKNKSVHICEWPTEFEVDKKIPCHADFDLFKEILGKIRQAKSVAQKSMKAEIKLTLEKDKIKKLGETLRDLEDVTCAKEIKEGDFKVEFI